MKTLIKVALVLVVLIVVVVGGAVYLGISSIDKIAKSAVERGGTYALGVPTTVQTVKVGLREGTVDLTGLAVANPPGYDGASFMTLATGGMMLDAASVGKPVIVLPRLTLAGLRLSLQKGSQGSNYQTILDHLKGLQGQSKPSDPNAPQTKFVINEVDIRDVIVSADLIGLPGQLSKVEVPIEQLRLTNVGTANGAGVDVAELASILLQSVIKAVVESGVQLPGDIAGELASRLGDLGGVGVEVIGKVGAGLEKAIGDTSGVVGAAGDAAKKAADDAAKKALEAADGLKRGIGDLIPGKKQPPPK